MNLRRPNVAASSLAGLLVVLTGCTAWPPARTAYHPAALPQANAAPIGASNQAGATIVRGQDAGYLPPGYPSPGNPAPAYQGNGSYSNRLQLESPGSEGYLRQGMPVSQAQYTPPNTSNPATVPPGSYLPGTALPPPQPLVSPQGIETAPPYVQPYVDIDPTMSTPVDVYVSETQTGRFMFGAGINSDAGVTGQIVIDERNFDITALPTSWRDFIDGTAFRGGGQGLRIEAMPGNQVQRYLVSFTEPYLMNTPISLNLSAFLFDRRYFDWDEQRLGGRAALGYRLTHDLSISGALRAESVDVSNPRVLVPELAEVIGKNELYSGRLTLTHDTRDIPFFPTEGHLIELSFEQVFGDFDYPRGELDYRKYFLVRERPDGSGRHTLGYAFQLGFSGAQTPVFENYFAGGYSTLRGFDFRGASPVSTGTSVRVGGEFRFLGSAEYVFPLTADDMLKGAFFVDYGTVEREIELHSENFRVSPGFGLRISVPALGPAPLAFDFAFPVAKADTDDTRTFSFFFGVGR
ncbi:MAG: BamA/TamA family outer membrane protein [Planctomycetes bacterium]|nr:BamA/TamA family outer membrane protein [Planctomycetota bacterium]